MTDKECETKLNSSQIVPGTYQLAHRKTLLITDKKHTDGINEECVPLSTSPTKFKTSA